MANATGLAGGLSPKDRRKAYRYLGWVAVIVVAVVALLWSTQAAPAKEVVGALRWHRFASMQTAPPDPERFLADIELVMPKPTIPLTVGDVIAQELLLQSKYLSQQDALRTAQTIVQEATAAGYDPLFVLAVIYVESDCDRFATSPVGAEGLMQIMPDTGEWMAREMGLERRDGHTFDPVLNVRLGTRYLAQLQRQFGGDVELALTAYNRGPANTQAILKRLGRLPETSLEDYSSRIIKRYRALHASYGSLPIS